MKDLNDPLVPSHYKRLKRGPQVVLPKDIGITIAYSGVNKNSVCVDAGTGSGWLAVSLAKVAKKVTSYDTREDFIKIAERNREIEKLDNLVFKNGDVTKKIDEKEVDLVTLDMPNSDKALKNAYKALKEGGCVVGYLPHFEQVKKFVETLNKLEFKDILTLETIVRDILVREQGVRPSTKGVWHTTYLVFAQK
ncbi:MAG TPA: methyltransferase domain-containing protein [Candidatus Acidoferrum sp.]|nr:methyltransferase domain-containing protein [Candidatus Acidoferrum sp.]